MHERIIGIRNSLEIDDLRPNILRVYKFPYEYRRKKETFLIFFATQFLLTKK